MKDDSLEIPRPRQPLFQERATDEICKRLGRKPRRFLVADEVGLGKTIITRTVLERLGRKRTRLRVLYVTSNAAIAAQNRSKLLGPHDLPVDVGRLTLVPLRLTSIHRQRCRVQLFSLSYHTSFSVSGSGLALERRLLLYLVSKVFGWNITERLAGIFQGAVTDRRWREATERTRLKTDLGSVRVDLRRLVVAWRPFVDRLRTARKGSDPTLVEALRVGLARVVLDSLAPDLIILDELQRFNAVEDSRESSSLLNHLLSRRRVGVLALSATPFDLRTHDGRDPHEELMDLLAFLWNEEPDSKGGRVAATGRAVARFQEVIRKASVSDEPDLAQNALAAKHALERCLRPVMCRTERARFFDGAEGVKHEGSVESAPAPDARSVAELKELVAAVGGKESSSRLLDYWSSSPSPLSFLDHAYRLHQHVGARVLHAPLRATEAGLASTSARSTRMKHLGTALFGNARNACLHLWVPPAPSMTYYVDDRLGAAPPKVLVFGHWRFVPRAIATVMSRLQEQRAGGSSARRRPLQFRNRLSFSAFDVAFPSHALARLVDPRAIASPDPTDMIGRAAAALREHLEKRNVFVRRHAPRVSPWRVIARLESDALDGLDVRKSAGGREDSQNRRLHLQQFAIWADDESRLEVAPRVVRRIAEIALFSPAVAFQRALRGTYTPVSSKRSVEVLNALMGYFNRPIVRRVVRAAASIGSRRRVIAARRRTYVDAVLEYAVAGHIQAVADEYAYLLCHVAQEKTFEDAQKHLVRVLSLRPPKLRVHFAGQKQSKPVATHFALAFADRGEADEDDTAAGAAHHRESVRMAFQSPFWPFVLSTTSVGQEGLDLHFYCRDVMHWNLPTSPIDLEQREGRIQRYLSFAVRRAIAASMEARGGAKGMACRWPDLIDEARRATPLESSHRRGLSPHWIFEHGDQCSIVRHLPFAWRSEDWGQYRRLLSRLAVYRLTFGQPDARAWMEELGATLDAQDPDVAMQRRARLRSYTLDLSPFDRADLEREARRCADEILRMGDEDAINRLERHAREVLGRGDLSSSDAEALRFIVDTGARSNAPGRARALAALVYLHNPFDDHLDAHPELGLVDDLAVVRATARAINPHAR